MSVLPVVSAASCAMKAASSPWFTESAVWWISVAERL
jgi:hypothetical protein